MAFIEPRSVQLRLLVARGAHEHAPSRTRSSRGRAGAATRRYARWRSRPRPRCCSPGYAPEQARALLAELERTTNIRAEPYYAALLPELVRTARALGDPELAARLVAGVEPRTPLAEQALCHCRAQLVEATGDHAEAAALYATAAEASGAFGNVPERAYALLGRGRC